MDTFFQHENHSYPPSLSDSGKLRLSKKSDIVLYVAKKDAKEAPNKVFMFWP